MNERIAKHYDVLTAEERARLILRADQRRDAGDLIRLHQTGDLITFAFRDHTPAVLAFYDVAMLVRIELLDTAALFRELLTTQVIRTERCRRRRHRRRNDHPRDISPRPGPRQLVRIAAHVLCAKFHGWCLFCERITVPAETGPPVGWDRLVRDVELADMLVTSSGMGQGNGHGEGDDRSSTLPSLPTATDFATGVESLYRDVQARWSIGAEEPNNCPGVASSSTAMCR